MNDLAIQNVLSQIRSLQARIPTPALPAGPEAVKPLNGGFKDFLSESLQSVSRAQSEAAQLQTRFELGDRNTDLAQVMLASAKAQVQFRGTVEVRNRLVQAYQDIMNMPV